MTTQPLKVLSSTASEPIVPKKPAVDPASLTHRQLLRGAFWQKIPAYKGIDEATFLDHAWQAKNSITKIAKLVATIQDLRLARVHQGHRARDEAARR